MNCFTNIKLYLATKNAKITEVVLSKKILPLFFVDKSVKNNYFLR